MCSYGGKARRRKKKKRTSAATATKFSDDEKKRELATPKCVSLSSAQQKLAQQQRARLSQKATQRKEAQAKVFRRKICTRKRRSADDTCVRLIGAWQQIGMHTAVLSACIIMLLFARLQFRCSQSMQVTPKASESRRSATFLCVKKFFACAWQRKCSVLLCSFCTSQLDAPRRSATTTTTLLAEYKRQRQEISRNTFSRPRKNNLTKIFFSC